MKRILGCFLMLMVVVSCDSKKSIDPVVNPLADGGLFVVNQGNFTYANASLSYYTPGDKEVRQSVFYQTNGVPLGDVAQSMTIDGDIAFVVINNSGFIYAIDRHTGEFTAKITGFESPRNMLFVNSQKAYVSDLYADYLSVVWPLTAEIIQHIPLGRSSEAMVMAEGKVFVANWSDYNQTIENNKILVIDAETDQMVDSIQVGKEPNSMVIDANGKLWVLCSGGYLNVEKPSLWQIDPSTMEIISHLEFDDINSNPTYLNIDLESNELFFLNKGVYHMDTENPSIPVSPFIPEGSLNFYALYIYPGQGELYVSDAGNYQSKGWVYRYDRAGNELDRFEAGIIPGGFLINQEK